MNSTLNKRKNEAASESTHKKSKMDQPKNLGIFTDDTMDKDTFALGDCVFVKVQTFRKKALVHVRRFKKYGETYFPTTEGVTLQPWWIEHIMGRKKVPETSQDLCNDVYLPTNQIQISSMDFQNFTFVRTQSSESAGTFTKSITITSSQWQEMITQYDAICTRVLDHLYKSYDFASAYESLAAETLQDLQAHLPNNDYLSAVLQNALCDALKEIGGLHEPKYRDCEGLWANRVESFNSAAFSIELSDIVNHFYNRLFEHPNFLEDEVYITRDFLNSIRLDRLLREARKLLCPVSATKYYEDLLL